MEVTSLAGAEADLFAAWVRYEELLPGLGDRFEAEVRAGLARILELPEAAPLYAGAFRRLLVGRFEHRIFYRVHGADRGDGCVRPAPRPRKLRERLEL